MQCSNGHSNPPGARFCGTCGHAVGVDPERSKPLPSGLPDPVLDFFNRFKSDLAEVQVRGYPTTLQSTLAMVSGVLFAAGVVVLAVYNAGDDGSTNPPGFWWVLVGIFLVYVITRSTGSSLVTGASSAVVPLIFTATFFLFRNQVEEGKLGAAFLVAGLSSASAWLLPVLRGRPALLAMTLLSFGFGLLVLLSENSITRALECASSADCLEDPATLFSENVQNASVAQLILGILMLIVAWALDRGEWPSIGRTFIGVGTVFVAGGAWGVIESSADVTAGAILLLIAGVLLVLVAVQRSRKVSLIIGGTGILLGLILALASLTENNETPAALIILLVTLAAGFAALAAKYPTQSERG